MVDVITISAAEDLFQVHSVISVVPLEDFCHETSPSFFRSSHWLSNDSGPETLSRQNNEPELVQTYFETVSV